MYFCKIGILPDILNETFSMINQVHSYNTRNSNTYFLPKRILDVLLYDFRVQDFSFPYKV